MITVRLPQDLEAEIDRLASTENRTKSDIVKDALKEYLAAHKEQKSSFEIGKDLFGATSSGDTNRSVTYKRRYQEHLREKYAH